MTRKQGEVDAAPELDLAERRAKLVETLKEADRFRQLLREAAIQLRADAAKLSGDSEAQRRRLLLESANRMDRYAADMESDRKEEPRR